MSNTPIAYTPVPVSENPEMEGSYVVISLIDDNMLNREYYFLDGDWYDDEDEARVNEHHFSVDLDNCHWLRPVYESEISALEQTIQAKDAQIIELGKELERVRGLFMIEYAILGRHYFEKYGFSKKAAIAKADESWSLFKSKHNL